ncbi:MAG: biotin synthase BioB [Thermodesulfovibrionales bacterium]
MIDDIAERAIHKRGISKQDALYITKVGVEETPLLFYHAAKLRETFKGKGIELCAIVNAKSGLCSEDCAYCSQSAISRAEIPVYPLIGGEEIIKKAEEAKGHGVRRFCIVTSGRRPNKKEIRDIAKTIKRIRDIGLLPCATLGLVDREDLEILKDSGLERYHHNLETSEKFFPEICSTHTYRDKLRTIEVVKDIGLSLCSGGIFGLGEEWEDRIQMAFRLKEIDVDSVPINFLIPIKGTLLGERDTLNPLEALKIVSLYRFMLSDKQIRICGGRRQVLGEFNSMVFMAGADSILTGDYLTTLGKSYEDDLKLIRDMGLEVIR